MKKNTRENLTNYIMSVQNLINILHLMENEEKINFDFLNKRIDVLQTYEDKLITELGGSTY